VIDPQEVAATLRRRREWIKQLWRDEQENGVTYREVPAAVQAMANKGYDAGRASALLQRGEELYAAGRLDDLLALICEINQALREAPRPAEPEDAPASVERIRGTWPAAPVHPALDQAAYFDRVLGGWLGKNIGGSLGGILEGWTRAQILARHGFVQDYVQQPPSTLNDDIAFEIVLVHALEEHGLDLTSAQLGREWVGHLPLEYCYTAEKVALANLLRGVVPPESGTLDNPFSEWIGAQMKGEVCGLIAPGRPDLAAEYAYRDGIIAHEREGVYGEIFVAAATSLAFVRSEAGEIVSGALDYVPPRSRYAGVVRQVLTWCQASDDWQMVCEQVEQLYGAQYHWVHVLPNAAIVVLALLLGRGDFARTVSIATTCGMDVDCNAGTVGAIVGVLRGASGIPARLVTPIGDRIDTWVSGFEQVSLRDLTRRTCALGQQLRQRWS
jgi:ADP-ribosylglycohydrolase